MINELTRHQIYIQRYSGGAYRELIPELKKLRDDISLKILSANTLYKRERLSILLKPCGEAMKNIILTLLELKIFVKN